MTLGHLSEAAMGLEVQIFNKEKKKSKEPCFLIQFICEGYSRKCKQGDWLKKKKENKMKDLRWNISMYRKKTDPAGTEDQSGADWLRTD